MHRSNAALIMMFVLKSHIFPRSLIYIDRYHWTECDQEAGTNRCHHIDVLFDNSSNYRHLACLRDKACQTNF